MLQSSHSQLADQRPTCPMQHLDQFRKCDYRIDGFCCDSRFEEGVCPYSQRCGDGIARIRIAASELK